MAPCWCCEQVYRKRPAKCNRLADNPRVRAVPLAVLGSLLLAAAVRLPALGARALATAEQAVFVESQRLSTVAVLPVGRLLDARALPRSDGPMPLDAAALALWTRLAGASEAALRLPSAIAGVLTAVLVALVAARLAGARAAAWAGALVALSPLHVLASRQAGTDAAVVLGLVLALFVLLRVEESGGRIEPAALGLCLAGLAASGSPGAAAFAPVALAWLATRAERRRAAALASASGLLVAAVAALAGGARSPLDGGSIPPWVPDSTASGIVRCAGASFTRVAGVEYQFVFARALEAIPLTAAAVGLMAWGAARLPIRLRLLLLAGAGLPFLAGAALAQATGRVAPLQAHRMLPALPFAALLAAVGIGSLRGPRAWAAGGLAGGAVAASLGLALGLGAHETSPTRAVAVEIALCRPPAVSVERTLDLMTLAAWGVPGPFLLTDTAARALRGPSIRVSPSSACLAGGAWCRALSACPASGRPSSSAPPGPGGRGRQDLRDEGGDAAGPGQTRSVTRS
jgi:hypothetical protein